MYLAVEMLTLKRLCDSSITDPDVVSFTQPLREKDAPQSTPIILQLLQNRGQNDETCSTKSCDVTMTAAAALAAVQTSKQQQQQLHRRPLLRAHSCGSLMGLKAEKALLSRNLPLDIWDLLRADVRAKAGLDCLDNDKGGGDANSGGGGGDIALKLAAAAAAGGPLTMLHLQSTSGSRCCNLC